jgi:hypothetical protein
VHFEIESISEACETETESNMKKSGFQQAEAGNASCSTRKECPEAGKQQTSRKNDESVEEFI